MRGDVAVDEARGVRLTERGGRTDGQLQEPSWIRGPTSHAIEGHQLAQHVQQALPRRMPPRQPWRARCFSRATVTLDSAIRRNPWFRSASRRERSRSSACRPTSSDCPRAPPGTPRSACHRAPASQYPDVLRALTRLKVAYEDEARRYQVLAEGARVHREPRPYQSEALAAWRRARGRGVVVLPTGAGKTQVAVHGHRRHAGAARWWSRPRSIWCGSGTTAPARTFGGPRRRDRRRRARGAAAHRHHLRLGLPAHGAPGRALRPAGLRRVPPPAGRQLRAWRRACRWRRSAWA